MLTKTTIALAMALTMGLASSALARSGEHRSGSRELGPGGVVTSGVNPAEHRSLGGNKPSLVEADGKCWGIDKAKVGGWSACPSAGHKHKA